MCYRLWESKREVRESTREEDVLFADESPGYDFGVGIRFGALLVRLWAELPAESPARLPVAFAHRCVKKRPAEQAESWKDSYSANVYLSQVCTGMHRLVFETELWLQKLVDPPTTLWRDIARDVVRADGYWGAASRERGLAWGMMANDKLQKPFDDPGGGVGGGGVGGKAGGEGDDWQRGVALLM
eukprot:3748648-Rhodomonas_salina.1